MVKRTFDILFGSIALLLSFPLFLLVAAAIKIDSKGSIFYLQDRAGLNGDIFKIYKFRSMISNAETVGEKLTQNNDARITKVGRIIRRLSIDELPQLINVVKGDMSIVGPRPEIVSITNLYTEQQKVVLDFKPGITGITQINGRAALEIEEKIQMDIEYYSNATLLDDLIIIARTPLVVLNNKGNIM